MKLLRPLLFAALLLGAAVVGAADSSEEAACPEDGPKSISCDEGQRAVYIPQNSLECAHYKCIDDNKADNDDDNDNDNNTRSVVLPAVLGSIIPLAAISAGALLFLHYRRRKQRAAEGGHPDAKDMSGYNNLDEYTQSPGAYSSTYSASKWRDSAFPGPTAAAASQTSIPIIFSADSTDGPTGSSRETKLYGTGAGAAAYRETRLFNGTASADDAQKWASPSVVNVGQAPQMSQLPQMVVLNPNAGPVAPAAAGLEIDTASVRAPAMSEAGATGSATADNGSPETGDSPGITQISTPVPSQAPRIVQVGKPQAVRAIEAEHAQAAPGSPLRVANNGWDSDDDDGGDDDESGDLSEHGAEPERESGPTGRLPSRGRHSQEQPQQLSLAAPLPIETAGDSFSKDVLNATNALGDNNDSPKKL
ncbi:hypothetical protein GGF46_004252 [Coemansia sp. RSA 552]|nr:hypothetical protein GGF46_004252 [Coemansia sp. RSA 552]